MRMLRSGLQELCDKSDNCRKIFAVHLKNVTFDEQEQKEILQKLCGCLMNPELTLYVAECFPQILHLLLSMVIIIDSDNSDDAIHINDQVHRLNCVIIGRLIAINPDVIGFALRYFEKFPAPFDTIQKTAPPKKRSRSNPIPHFEMVQISDYDLVHACYNILRAAPNHFKHNWNWSSFYEFLIDDDNKIQWIALKCIGIVLNMSNSTIAKCAETLIPECHEFLVNVETDRNKKALMIDNSDANEVESVIDNSNSLVSIAGVLLPVFKLGKHIDPTTLIPVQSMESNLRSLALAVASRKCVCLQGPVGCGKTALVEYLAQMTGRGATDFIKVQLGDQTDSKMLLGTYRCTDIPGEFVWQPGVLTQCVMSGKWLLLEDIDSAALDVASVLSNLMETGTLSVPGYRDTIYAKSGFQLFVTQRLISSLAGFHRQSTGASNLLEKHWLCINMDPLTKDELVTIIQKLFPSLATIATKIVNVFLLFSMGNHESATSNEEKSAPCGRLISTRDLMKWCTRAIVDYDVSSRESSLKLLYDAIDIYCCSVADREKRLELAISIEHTLGIVDKAKYYVNEYKPSVFLHTEIFSAGRAKVPKKIIQYAQVDQAKVNFSFTRPSAALLERVTICVAQKEPVLLVGETGTGKTSSIQFLARSTGHKLVVVNMNQQSESADLLGGYKPVDMKYLITPIREEFEILFRSFYAIEPNKKFLEHIGVSYKHEKWRTLVSLMCHSVTAALKRLRANTIEESKIGQKRKSGIGGNRQKSIKENCQLLDRWEILNVKLTKLKSQLKTEYSLAFSFIEGSLIKALKEGYWVLLDEINLASSETLECLSGLLEGSCGSLSLLERGDRESIKRHNDFTIFACMNPATDVGKKELPVGLRNRFTEFYVDELTDSTDLHLLVNSYLATLNLQAPKHGAIVKFYLNVRKEATNSLNDGTGHKPHYSLRTLCRALSVAATNPCGNPIRSLYEAFCLSFLTQLDHRSYPIVQKMIAQGILDMKNMRAVLGAPIPKPKCASDEDYINFEGYWVMRGEMEPKTPEKYILTSSIRRNLKDLVRVVSIGKMPVLLQGDTSVGKTSLITYLAKASGNICVRINNHEHTDLQEYVGNYVADQTGKLVFKEGVLVEAMRKGHWIILDELNLAPSDVLEALNRVLDDNRELFIPETQQTVKAHNNFMLFATQNPPGVYGGRKVLSRAFRNRFVELHFDEIPAQELQVILRERCGIADSYSNDIVNVMTELQIRRKSTAAFSGKQGFITLRDLFRWGERYKVPVGVCENNYDWRQHLAEEGYLVLAAKVRRLEEAEEIQQVIEKHLKRKINPDNLFSLHEKTSPVTRAILEEIFGTPIPQFQHVVWTYPMRRMAVLVKKSCEFQEPVLLVGETGGGKTTVCQILAATKKSELLSVNCHMHTESSDFLGNLRPVRDRSEANNQKLFEWVDGPLITAMKNGYVFLADEISLADDSVLERMNSLLEPERSLLLAEKNTDSTDSNECNSVITAHANFCFIGTMNPGGDYGKKELSPALRNRFAEIWCEGCVSNDDLKAIIKHNLLSTKQDRNEAVSNAILHFLDFLKSSEVGKKFTISIRDVLTWVNFINSTSIDVQSRLNIADAFTEGAYLTYLDSLGSGVTCTDSKEKMDKFKDDLFKSIESYVQKLRKCNEAMIINETNLTENDMQQESEHYFCIDAFRIPVGPNGKTPSTNFTFTAPTTKLNTRKILRALQLHKPLMLEGSPGVGKTSLVSAIARAAGYNLVRINLSDQTDVSDLFGADLPVEGGKGGEFAWKDGPFLRALKGGDWILLDELNLASQSVLEGLNACLDHRGEIYIPELGRTFIVKNETKLFACQNPLSQGGARRGLPKSFLNRFTQVFVEALSDEDLKIIAQSQFPDLSESWIDQIIDFNSKVLAQVGKSWGHSGAPWEMNLRDIVRWCELTNSIPEIRTTLMNDAAKLLYVERMRTKSDRKKMENLYCTIFASNSSMWQQPLLNIDDMHLYFDDIVLPRTENSFSTDHNLFVLRSQIPILKSLAQCVRMNWMPILVGASGTGKSSVVRLLAQLAGQKLRSIVVNSAMDTTEILGGFEQTDYNRHLETLIDETENLLIEALRMRLNKTSIQQAKEFHRQLEKIQHVSNDDNSAVTMAKETEIFLRRTEELFKLISAMKTMGCSSDAELAVIENKLGNLADLVKQDNCLNAGGKFEWVDSVLVKCLKDGSWLLVDQVNLCSPAVLDRLNGLLEPGGVLTIGERGVDNDGNIHTIIPHKNFRLFLTMDPRYGEISRAMRNRGVEIFLVENDDFDNANILDIRSMLFDLGLTANNHQDTLLNIHHEILCDGRYTDKLSTIQLLHSAFLITQQISRGFSVKDAFTNACIDVYIKSKYIHHSEVKEHLMSIINNNIQKYNVNEYVEPIVDLSAATLNIRNLQDNTKTSIVKQHAVLLLPILDQFRRQNSTQCSIQISTEFMSKYLNTNGNFGEGTISDYYDVDIENLYPHLLFLFFIKSSLDDVEIRKRLLENYIHQNDIILSEKQRLTIEKMTTEITRTAKNLGLSSQPWYSHALCAKVENVSYSRALSISMALHLICFDVIGIETPKMNKSKKNLSIVEYSYGVHKHLIAERNSSYSPLIEDFYPFILKMNEWLLTYVNEFDNTSNSISITDFRLNVLWFKRFYELGRSLSIKASNPNDIHHRENNESILLMHYRWLRNNLITYDWGSIEAKLTHIMSKFDGRLYDRYNFRKHAKSVKKLLHYPSPFTTETIATTYQKLYNSNDIFSLMSYCHLDFERKLIRLQLEKSLQLRYEVIDIWKRIFNSELDLEANDTLLRIDKFVSRENIHKSLEEVSNTMSDILTSNTNLWPLYQFIFYLFANKLHKQITCNTDVFLNENSCDQNLVTKFNRMPCIPPNLMAIINVILDKTERKADHKNLLPELFTNLTLYRGGKWRSEYLRASSIKDEVPSDDYYSEMSDYTNIFNYCENKPILTMILSDMLISDRVQLKKNHEMITIASLNLCGTHIKLMNTINHMLWRNSISFNSVEYNQIMNDKETLLSYIKPYLTANIDATMNVTELYTFDKPIEVPNVDNAAVLMNEENRDEDESFDSDFPKYFQHIQRTQTFLDHCDDVQIDHVRRGLGWIYMGCHQLLLFTHLEVTDPVIENKLKTKYYAEDIKDLKTFIYANDLDSHIHGDDGFMSRTNSMADSLIDQAKKVLDDYQERLVEAQTLTGYRSPHSSYSNFVTKVSDIRRNPCIRQTVDQCEFILLNIANYNSRPYASWIQDMNGAIETLNNLQRSWLRLFEIWKSEHLANYREFLLPILNSMSYIIHGVDIIMNETEYCVAKEKTNFDLTSTAEYFLHNLVRFPTIGPNQEDLLQLIDLYTSQSGREFIEKNLSDDFFTDSCVVQITMMMIKNGLHELYNYINLTKQLTPAVWNELNQLLVEVVLVWQKQRVEKEKSAAESASLYKNKTDTRGVTLTEEEEIDEQLKKLFPAYRDTDFALIDVAPSLEAISDKATLKPDLKSFLELIDEDDYHEVYRIHSLIVRSTITAPWVKSIESPKRNYIDPLLQRFKTFSFILPELEKSLTSNLSTKLHMSFNMLTAISASINSGKDFVPNLNDMNASEKPYDFYNSSNVGKIQQCLPILKSLMDKIETFLKEWPEHPTLKSIVEILDRINNFSVTSPISRFLTGFELLLTKMREWEENAHSGVSLSEYTTLLTQQIIDWRRLELNCWKDCLNTAFERLKAKASKWWFFLYSLVESYTTKSSIKVDHSTELFDPETIQSNEIVTAKKFIELLDIFMTQSSLVEFQARLDLILTFHCHVFHLENSSERDELLAIFWNMYNYYGKFTGDVEKRINSVKAPIEKKLRDFVKIARWNDINYWSVKETVEKTHRTLLKYIREYETGLKQNVGACLIVKPTSYTSEANKGEWDRSNARDYAINPQDFVISQNKVKEIDVPFMEKGDLISRSNKNLTIATDLCKKIVLMSSYPGLRVELEHLIEDFTNHSIKLKNMEIDRTLPKPKQKSYAKSILQQKKRALADYFKTLTNIGVSYRRGTQAWLSRQNDVLNMTISPLDISTTMHKLGNLSKADKQMLAQWDGCDTYYYKSLIKLQALHSAMGRVQTDLGPQNVERCRGYSTHLMLMAHDQKQLLAESFNTYTRLRKQIMNLAIIENGNVGLPYHEDISVCADLLKKLLTCLLTGLEQLELYLHACPEGSDDFVEEKSMVLKSSSFSIVHAYKNDDTWQSANTLIKDATTSVNSIFQEYERIFGNISVPLIRTPTHFNSLKYSRDNLVNVATKIAEFGRMFGNNEESFHPILETIEFLVKQTNRWIDQFNSMKIFDSGPTPQYDSDLKDLRMNTNNMVETIFLVMQKKYKEAESENDEVHHDEGSETKNLNDEADEEETSKLEENGFREKLIEALSKDIVALRINEVESMLESTLRMTQALDPLAASFYNSLLLKCLPILEQYLLFVQFYLNEQVAAFRTTCKFLHLQLNVFLDLATNGFCVPKDLDLEEGEADPEGTEQSKDQGGMGLGDGEGKKDVSDRIESEDQLEDARPADEERKDEDKDCKEEDGGIDMSENFDGKMQDIDENSDNENDEKSDDEEEKNLDKEMGDTETGADQLDKEIWGDDEEEDESEEQDDNTDEQGKGEQIGEKELSAKDESKDTNDDQNESKETREESDEMEKKEINEMNEPDVNDDQIDPYHGKHDPQPEPEPMDLPEDLNLDGDDEGKEDAQGNEDPFDIDEMKTAMPPEKNETDLGEDLEKEGDKNDNENLDDDSSDEEQDTAANEDTQMKDLDAVDEDDDIEPEVSNQQAPGTNIEEEEEMKSDENEENEVTENDQKVGPSTDDASKETDSAEQTDCKADGSRDKVANQPKQEQRQESTAEENSQEDGNDKGTGQAQSEEQSEGHVGSAMQKNTSVQNQPRDENTTEKRKKPGESDENRALVDDKQPNRKKQKIHNREELGEADEEDAEGPEQGEDGEVDMCQHVKDSEKYDTHAIDAATEEQVKTQQVANSDDEDPDKDEEEPMDIDMQQDADKVVEEEIKAIDSEITPKTNKKDEEPKSKSKGTNNLEDNTNMENNVDVEGENVDTMGAARAAESAFFTNIVDHEMSVSLTQVERKRLEVEQMLSQWTYMPSTAEALAAWNCLSAVTEAPARDLSEKLRLVLEPTQATRLKGDYRTGKRINMRKIIPYIASQFRKDKIWLRRTKPSKRDYQIILALDDSSSMADNHSKELAFESLSLISKAMGYLEVGQLSVISFGESPKVLHPLGEPFTEQSGSRLIQEMRFDQKKTMMGQLVDFTVDMFENQRSSTDNAKLLVVLSDGRGIFSEGVDYVNRAVRRAKLADIFLVFIIVENPQNKDSILDIRMPVFENGKLLEIRPYMDSFPFPFYMILRDINALPGVLSDALRQWFEVVGKIDT